MWEISFSPIRPKAITERQKEKPMSRNASPEKNKGCLSALFNPFGGKTEEKTISAEADTFPYRLRDDFLSPAEKSFYLIVKGIMGNTFTLCTKVSLADIFYVTNPNENKSARNRIDRKHVDFLICNAQTMTPVFAIELDDSSHTRPDRIERDEFVDGVFEAANLPLLHVPVRASYNTAELGVLFRGVIQKNQTGRAIAPAEVQSASVAPLTQEKGSTQPPNCPKCGTPMVLRTVKNGNQAGKQFYGCVNYPKCRGILPITE